MRAPTRKHLPTLLWAFVVAVGLLIPGPGLARFGTQGDWPSVVAHLVLFLVLAALLQRSLSREGAGRSVATAIGIAFLYGALLEVLQITVEERGLDPLDFVLNGLGAVVGAVAAGRFDSRRAPR